MTIANQLPLVVVTLALACTGTSTPEQQRATPTEPAQASPVPTVYASSNGARLDGPGSAYFIVRDRGVVRLDHGAWTLIEPAHPHDDARQLVELFIGADGHAYGLGWRRLVRLEGDRIEEIANAKHPGSFSGAAVGRAGEIALFEARRRPGRPMETELHIARDGLLLTSTNRLVLERVPAQAGFDDQARLWIWDSQRAMTIERMVWPMPVDRRVDVALPKHPEQPATFAASPTGEIYMFVEEAAFHLSGPRPVAIALPGVTQPRRASVSANGNFALAWPDSCAIVRVSVDDPPRIETIDPMIDCHFEHQAQAIDSQDRIWVPSSTGLWVFVPGEAPIQYGLGTVPLLDAGAGAVAVVGAGPTLPPPERVRRTGLRGRLVVEIANESPANQSLVLRPGNDPAKQPPEWVFHATTDEAGDFAFSEVPIGRYTLSLANGRYIWFLSDDLGAMREGEVLDLGLLQWTPGLLELHP